FMGNPLAQPHLDIKVLAKKIVSCSFSDKFEYIECGNVSISVVEIGPPREIYHDVNLFAKGEFL
ncbi:unnamed protein product, partial [marine sediment metagenome]